MDASMSQILAFLVLVLLFVLVMVALALYANRSPAIVLPAVYESGCLVGYKKLFYRIEYVDGLPRKVYYSPDRMTRWTEVDGHPFLEADQKPTVDNFSGIYALKDPSDPWLDEYQVNLLTGAVFGNFKGEDLVKVLLYGKYIEGRTGIRAQYARVACAIHNPNKFYREVSNVSLG